MRRSTALGVVLSSLRGEVDCENRAEDRFQKDLTIIEAFWDLSSFTPTLREYLSERSKVRTILETHHTACSPCFLAVSNLRIDLGQLREA